MYVADSRASTSAASGLEGAVRPRAGRRRAAVAPTVLALGAVSLITDVSSEMVTAVLPLYLVTGLGLSPLGFGLLDGISTTASRLCPADRGPPGRPRRRPPQGVAGFGYALSAACKPLLLLADTLTPIGLILAADRTGRGLRTAPRDALISLSSTPETTARVRRAPGDGHGGRAVRSPRGLPDPRATVDGYDAVFTVSFCVAVVGVLVLVLFVPNSVNGARTKSDPDGARTKSGSDGARTKSAPDGARTKSAPDGARFAGDRDGTAGNLRAPHPVPPCARPSPSSAAPTCAASPSARSSWASRDGQRLLRLPASPAAGRTGPLVRAAAPRHGGGLPAPGRPARPPRGPGRPLAGVPGRPRRPAPCVRPPARLLHGTALPYAVLLLHGCFYAATDGVLMAVASESVPEELRSSGLALVQTGQALARFVCSLGFGAAWTAWGDRTALTASTVALALCALFALTLRRPTPSAPSEGLA